MLDLWVIVVRKISDLDVSFIILFRLSKRRIKEILEEIRCVIG